MEVAGEGDGNPPPENWKKTPEAEAGESKPPKRKMKSPYQLEVLEQTYAVETYPSEAQRAELSAKIGLSDRQLQMWFCHRRLKDRKYPPPAKRAKEETPPPPPQPLSPPQVRVPVLPSGEMTVPNSPFVGESRKAVRVARMEMSSSAAAAGRRFYEPLPPPQMVPVPTTPQLSMAELQVIASVEAQLGEPLREEGPILGVEFEPLPPGAFGAPIAMTPQQKQPLRSYNGKLFERHDTKSMKASVFLPNMEHSFMPSSSSGKRKSAVGGVHVVHPQAGSRALHEYQFLPEQRSIRAETYDRLPQSHCYDPSMVAPNSRVSSLPAGGQYLHGNEQVSPAYTFQGQMSSAGILSQQGRQQIFSPGQAEYENVTSTATDAQISVHQVVRSESPYLVSDRNISRDEDASRVERKRKTEEARIAKEVEAHEKRIRKELEKQDILRRKREEQMKREMEKHDRERRKEEERLMREKQREEERFQREQRRENERREKFLQKESMRTEKMKQKEEMRREKEAARQKAANERATARRIAREYMELVEDERLELMELAASSKGVSSIVSLDSETLQQLDMFRDKLSTFPPNSVQLKRPFSIYPWIESEEDIGNLLMVWKFLITFVDDLQLWPLTLDEFVQALHDYDSKLLREIHFALLKSIIRDIEDVARTPAIGLGTNQNSAANPGGGHQHIVEGAYAWGFDIRSWQRHLNFFTWPEIFRQFAISAGFGPRLKKRNVERTYYRDDNEGNDGEDVISTLRNGAAAENAVSLMHERGYSHRRRSRHRLTPGTVKFAAFHVLSLEGSRGLTILEVANKIQRSGLRDLTTSKTPEASIAAALSRDTKLFERTAPSTYCVRASYRKDPADAEAILSDAREKIQVFQNELSDLEEVEKDVEDADDVERDEDSECDGADDPEVDDARTVEKSDVVCANELEDAKTLPSVDCEKGEGFCEDAGVTPRPGINADKSFVLPPSGNSNNTSVSGAPLFLDRSPNCQGKGGVEDTEIDDNNFGEPWVQALTDSDYSELTPKERLDALVALIGVAIEGNSIRVILEERLEAASALKKQMWADAQLDKRRFREDYISKLQYPSFAGPKAEVALTIAAIEGSQTPPDVIDNKGYDGNLITDDNDQFLDPQFQIHVDNMSAERNPLGQDFPTNSDSLPLQQYAYAAEKSRAQFKSYIGHKVEQLHVYRSLPLGQDRRRNRYWMFSTTTSPNDRGSGRIFFESKDGFWRLIDSNKAFDSLLSVLDTRGIREAHLHSMLQRIEPTFKEAIKRSKKHTNSAHLEENLVKTEAPDSASSPNCHVEIDSPSSSTVCGHSSDTLENSSSFNIELGKNEMERDAVLKRYQTFNKWVWKECYNPFILCAMKYGKKRCSELLQTCHFCYECYLAEERHCPSCHKTFKGVYDLDAIFSDHTGHCDLKRKMDPGMISQTSAFSLPIGIQLLKAQLSLVEVSVPAEALQPFWTEGYRKSWGAKLHTSSSSEDLLKVLTLLEGAIKRDYLSSHFETTSELLGLSKPGFLVEEETASVSILPWIPCSTAAVALRLLDLDASIFYMLHQKMENHREKEPNNFIKLPSRFTVVKNIQEAGSAEIQDHVDYQREVRWLDPGSGHRGRGRGTRGRGRGRGRGGRRLRADFNEENDINYQKPTRKYTRRGRTRGRGRKRGRRTVRPRQRSETRVPIPKEPLLGSFGNVGVTSIKQDSFEESPRSSGRNEWGLEPTGPTYVEEVDISAASASDDENGLASGDEYDDQTANYVIGYNHSQPAGLLDDETEEEDDDEDLDEYMDADVDEEDEEEIGGDEDDDFSSEYSD